MLFALAAVPVFALGGFVGSLPASRAADALLVARHDASVARELSRAADNRAELLAERAAGAEHRADSLERLPARTIYRTVAAAAPDTCRVVVRAANAALAQDSSAAVSLHEALDSTKVALTTVRGSTRQLEAATANLERAAKPSLLRALLPHPHLGVTAGIDATGRPAVVAGIGFGWSL